MKTAVLIPTRGDRPDFLAYALKQIEAQTAKPDVVHVVDFPPVDGQKDITKRYRIGLTQLAQAADLIFFWEDDDWYHPTYLEKMQALWRKASSPELFGLAKTCYYHLKIRKYTVIQHPGRASAMATAVRADAIGRIGWPADDQPFFDVSLWKCLRGVGVDAPGWPCIGIKHGIGLSGGIGHRQDWNGFNHSDSDMSWLESQVGSEAVEFYKTISA